jgi:hypothetical protein
MKARLFFLLLTLLLVGCSNISTGNTTPAPDFAATDAASQIGTVIAERATEAAIEALHTPTPTPGEAALRDLILSSDEANALANRWSDSPADDSLNIQPGYCGVECISLIWEGGADGNSTLDITLVKAGSRDEAVTLFNSYKVGYVTEATPEIPLPDLVNLPEGSFVFEGLSRRGAPIWGLATRQSSIVIIIALNMPDLSEDENIIFLSLFADKQIQKLIAAGH